MTAPSTAIGDLSYLDFNEVRDHYNLREGFSAEVSELLHAQDAQKFAELSLGIVELQANYSAAEHNLGPLILSRQAPAAILRLGAKLETCQGPKELVDTIYTSRIPYLKISVGSEIAMMVRPETFWVANIRTIWGHLLVKHKFRVSKANLELRLYRDPERTSEMDYKLWKDIYFRMASDMDTIGRSGGEAAAKQCVEPGSVRNIWNDAVANALYEYHT